MKSVSISLALLLSLFFFPSCRKGFLGVTGRGNVVEESRHVSGYNGIDLRCNATIDYVQDSVFSISLSAQSNILEVLRTSVEGETLVIEFDKGVRRHKPIHIVIHSPGVNALLLSGSGRINTSNTISGSDLSLRISGSGNINISSLNVQQLSAGISGSGNINLAGGTATSESFSVSGSGNIKALDVSAATNTSKISGSGDISVKASDALDLIITGSGNIRYTGTPVINSRISGSGKIIHI